MIPDTNQRAQPDPQSIDSIVPGAGISPQRRAAMLSLLQRTARDRCRQRKFRQRLAGIVPVVLLLTGVSLWWMPRAAQRPDVARVASGEESAASAAGSGEREESAAGAVGSGGEITTAGIAVDRIDDDELLDMLSAIGRPAGLARINGRVEVVAMENPPSDQP
jgi:hypothetical protein